MAILSLSWSLVLLVLITIGIYSLLSIGMNMHWGDTGLLNFAHAGFFAAGAYTSAILTTPVGGVSLLQNRVIGFDLPIVVGMIAAAAVAALFGVLIGATSVRLEGDYLAIVTLASAEMLRLIIGNEEWLTSGHQTLKNIPRPMEETIPETLPIVGGAAYDAFYFLLVMAIVAGAYLLFRHLSNSPFGRVLHAIREDEDVPMALGKRTGRFKLKAFGLGAGIAGLAGALWAHYVFAIQPVMFLPNITFVIWAAVILGGAGNYLGAILGTAIIVLIQQMTRFLPTDIPLGDKMVYIRLMIIGALLIAVLYYRPYGLLGDEERSLAGLSEGGE